MRNAPLLLRLSIAGHEELSHLIPALKWRRRRRRQNSGGDDVWQEGIDAELNIYAGF